MNEMRLRFRTRPALAGITRRAAVRALPLAIAVALTFGAAAGPEAASAAPKNGAGGTSCFYNGVEYSHGSIVKFDNGQYYWCDNGEWKWYSSTGNYTSPAITANPVQVITAEPALGSLDPVQVITADPVPDRLFPSR